MPNVCWMRRVGDRFQNHSPSPVVLATLKLFEYVSLSFPSSLVPNVNQLPVLNMYWAVMP